MSSAEYQVGLPNTNTKSVQSALALLCNKNGKYFMFENTGVIGRSPTAFLCVTDSQISRKHCIIEKTDDNKFMICDTSNFGTFVNGEKLIKNQPQELLHLDRIKLAGLDAYSYVFLINKKHLGIVGAQKRNKCSVLKEKMIDLNETQSLEKDKMDEELNLVKTEMRRLEGELQQKLKAREDELEREKLKASMESAYNKEQADKAELMIKEYECKITDVTKKIEELQNTKSEMGKRHQIEREELENKCKAEIEELKKKLEMSETKNQQFEELQAKLEETKSVLLESELEQQRLFDAKVEVETKLKSEILDLTNERDEQVKELEKKLKEMEEKKEKTKKEIEGLEDDMMCSICAELYIEPTAVNCGHLFCNLCIAEWSKKKKICPMCRANISTTIRIYNMDSVIEKNVSLMSEEIKARREAVIAERKSAKKPQKKHCPKKRRRQVAEPSTSPQRSRLRSMGNGRVLPRVNVLNSHFPPFVPSATRESEGDDDPFGMGWIREPFREHVRQYGNRTSPVTVAAVDLTTPSHPIVRIPIVPDYRVVLMGGGRAHTVTSADANSTIDLTNT